MVFMLSGENGGVSYIHAAKLPDGDYLLKGSIDGGCRNHVGAARQLSLTTSVQLRDAGMAGENILLSPNLKYVVSTLYDGKRPNDPSVRGRIRAWDAATGARIAEWQAHKATIQSLAISPRGDLLASSASDRSVAVWALPEGRQISTWVDATESIHSLTFDATGTTLIGSGKNVTRIWNVATGSLRYSFPIGATGAGPLVVSPDGSLIGYPAALLDVRSGQIPRSIVLDARSGQIVRSIELDGHPNCMAFSPDGRYVALCQWDRIDLWDVSSWRTVWKFSRDSRHVSFRGLAFHPNGQHLAASLGDSIWLLDLRTGEPIAFVPGSLKGTEYAALGFASSDNALVALTGSQVNRWPTDEAIGTNDCTAPPTAVRILSPTCLQLWATHLFRQIGPPHFDQWSASIDQFERGALTAEMWINRVTTIGGLLVTVFKAPNDALKAAEILYDANGTLLTLIPIEDPVIEIGVEAVNTVRNGIKTAIIYSVRGTASPPYTEMVSLANKIAALWNTNRITRERNTLTLVREYLRQLYSFGGDQGNLAEAHGLPRQAAMQDVVAAINKNFGFVANPLSGNSYSPVKTEKAIIAWTGAITDLAKYKQKSAQR